MSDIRKPTCCKHITDIQEMCDRINELDEDQQTFLKNLADKAKNYPDFVLGPPHKATVRSIKSKLGLVD